MLKLFVASPICPLATLGRMVSLAPLPDIGLVCPHPSVGLATTCHDDRCSNLRSAPILTILACLQSAWACLLGDGVCVLPRDLGRDKYHSFQDV